jgi:serine protease
MHDSRESGSGSAVWKLDHAISVAQAQEIARLIQSGDRRIKYAHADTMLHPAFVPNDPYYGSMWSYADSTVGISLPAAWDVSTGAGATVAVIDTGYRPHVDLTGQIVGGYDFISNVTTANDGDGRDSDAQDPGDWGSCSSTSSWHGTHVSGTIAALANNGIGSLGVAFNSRVVMARVLGVCGGYTSDIADGIRWAAGYPVSGVASNANPARILNLSLSGAGSCPTELSSAISAARSLGALVVVAAGNNALDASGYQPANCAGVLTVAATDSTGARATFSNYGTVVGIAAPGVSIWSTLNAGSTSPGADTYASYSGTSMATPHVAGVAALVSSINPGLDGDQIASILKSTAKAFPGSCAGCGSGIVNAKAAVDATKLTFTISPTRYDFGTLVEGSTATKTFVISNVGSAGALNVSLAPSNSQYSISSTTCPANGQNMGAQSSCFVTISFLARTSCSGSTTVAEISGLAVTINGIAASAPIAAQSRTPAIVCGGK